MNVLAVDIGGTHIKFCAQQQPTVISIPSVPKMTPKKMLQYIDEQASRWNYDCVSLGFPGPVVHHRPISEPFNLGKGWVTFCWKRAFGGRPMRMLNDAAMQALGSYKGGRMLFLGLGTGLGSAMIVDDVVQAMELAHLPWKKGKTYEEHLGTKALKRDGRRAWRKHVMQSIDSLSAALESEYVVLGGGNAKLMKQLPRHALLGSNENAMQGAFLLWGDPHRRV